MTGEKLKAGQLLLDKIEASEKFINIIKNLDENKQIKDLESLKYIKSEILQKTIELKNQLNDSFDQL